MPRHATWILVSALVFAKTGMADPVDHGPSAGQTIMPPPPTYQGTAANVTEHLGAALPLDAVFRDQDGKPITLRQVVTGDLPTILTFNYADCPMLCSQQLNGLTAAMPFAAKRGPVPGSADELSFALGEHYRIVTISLEPNENQAKLQKMRSKYLERVGTLSTDAGITLDATKLSSGWTFLTGDAAQVKRVADAVGFGYAYLPDRGEWAHPAAFMFLSSAGVITRYVYGIEFPDRVLAESIYKAGLAEPATATGFMLRCYHWDPSANDNSRVGVLALRIGAAGAVAALAVFGLFQLVRRKREVT